jgi:hypothetical protein
VSVSRSIDALHPPGPPSGTGNALERGRFSFPHA